MTWSLKRTRQCKKCPWRVDCNPRDITNGYCEVAHKKLKSSVAGVDGNIAAAFGGELHIMACHETDDAHCIGWLVNQLGAGNNIGMRLSMMDCTNGREIKLVGEQHETFEDTLP